MKSILLFGLEVYSGSFDKLKKDLDRWFQAQTKLKLVATPNPEQVVLADTDKAFLKVLNQFDILVPDGVGLIWASRLLKDSGLVKERLTERVAGVDLVSWLLKYAFEHNLKVLLVGGKNLGKLKIQNLKLKIEDDGELIIYDARRIDFNKKTKRGSKQPVIYWTPAYKNKFKREKKEQVELEKLISQLKPNIVLVAFGAPFQEAWLIKHRQLLKKSEVKLGMVVGGAFDMLVGKLPRAPRLIRQAGLEWFWRLILEPSRIKRQLKLLKFIWLTLNYPKPH